MVICGTTILDREIIISLYSYEQNSLRFCREDPSPQTAVMSGIHTPKNGNNLATDWKAAVALFTGFANPSLEFQP